MKKNYQILLVEDFYDEDLNKGSYFSGGFNDRAICEIASNTSTHKGQAYNISFYSKIDGTHELSFSIPHSYFDEDTGEKVENPLTQLLVNKSKIELKIEEEGEVKTYYLIINSRNDKDEKGLLSFSYTCSDMFIEELSKTGYGITFSSNLNSTSGLGTIHELAERVLEDSEWEYVKKYDEDEKEGTGTLYEYKTSLSWNEEQERFDEVYTPIPVHPIKYISEVSQYCYETELFKNTVLFGDVNLDGKVTIEDAERLSEAINSRLSIPYPALLKFTYQDNMETQWSEDPYKPIDHDLEMMYEYILQSRFSAIGEETIINDFQPNKYKTQPSDIQNNFDINFIDTTVTDGVVYLDLARVNEWSPSTKVTYRNELETPIRNHFLLCANGEYNNEVFMNELSFYGQLFTDTTDENDETTGESSYYYGRTFHRYIRYRGFNNLQTKSGIQFQDVFTTYTKFRYNYPINFVSDKIKKWIDNPSVNTMSRTAFMRLDTDGNGKLSGSYKNIQEKTKWKWRNKGESEWKEDTTLSKQYNRSIDPEFYDCRKTNSKVVDPIMRKIREVFPSELDPQQWNFEKLVHSSSSATGEGVVKINTENAKKAVSSLLEELYYMCRTPAQDYLYDAYLRYYTQTGASVPTGLYDGFKYVSDDIETNYVTDVLNFCACLLRIASEGVSISSGDPYWKKWFNSQEYYFGDIDLDGRITMKDYELLKNYLANQLDDTQVVLGNVHKDVASGSDYDPNSYTIVNNNDVQDIVEYVNSGGYTEKDDEASYDKQVIKPGRPAYNVNCYHRIYCYDESECINSNAITNIMYNSSGWVDLVGWDTFTTSSE